MFWIAHINNISSCSKQQLECYLRTLTTQELSRYRAYSNSRKRDQFLLGRILMRIMLSQTFNDPPHTWRLTANGPLAIVNRKTPAASINLSHSKDYVLCGLHSQGLLGVDIQFMNESRNYQRIAQHYFSAREAELIGQVSVVQKPSLFYRMWCLKEAMVKAHGQSIMGNIQSLCIQHLDTDNTLHFDIEREFKRDYSITSWCWGNYAIGLVSENQLDASLLRLVSIDGFTVHVDETLDLQHQTQSFAHHQ